MVVCRLKILVTGSAGHLGEALVRVMGVSGYDVRAIDIQDSPFTTDQGSLLDRKFVSHCMQGVHAVVHTATLHKPHVVTHTRQSFVDTNITGTLNLLEEAVLAGVKCFVFTSTTSVFGDALIPEPGVPAAWVTEEHASIPKNIYGVTKMAAENLCQLFYRNQGLACVVLRTSRFFPEEDDNKNTRQSFADENIKVCEFLSRRVDIADVVDAHLLAIEKGPELGFDRYIISATTPFEPAHLAKLRGSAESVLTQLYPEYKAEFFRRGWHMLPGIDRVYVNEKARDELGWQPRYDFAYLLKQLEQDQQPMSEMTRLIRSKGYHDQRYFDGPYPVES